jgi:hypothetical protein
VELTGPNLKKVVLGFGSNDQFFRQPQEQKRDPARFKLDRIGSYGIVYIRWLVEGSGPYEVTVTSIKGGTASKTAP